MLQVPDAVKGDVRNQRILQRKLSAALVCSLANVNAFTKIVLMDTRGGTTKPLAREICSQGYRAFILKGGYTLWSRVGLATKKGSYEVTAGMLSVCFQGLQPPMTNCWNVPFREPSELHSLVLLSNMRPKAVPGELMAQVQQVVY